MSATAENLRDLHELHQRAKALRDRLTSGPKTLAARQAALANRQAELEKPARRSRTPRSSSRSTSTSLQSDRQQDRRPQDQAQPGQEERRVQGPSEPDRPRSCRQVEDRGRDPGPARGRSKRETAELGKARGRRETVRRRGRRASSSRSTTKSVAQKAQLAELETAIVAGRARDPRRTTGSSIGASSRAMAPTPWPSARMARASAVSRHSRPRWSTT